MKELKFIHITKCAGTYIENLGKKYNIMWGRFHKEYGYWHSIFPAVRDNIKKKYDWFMVVRNPYERILSEYYCKWGGIGSKNINHTKEQMNQFLINKIKSRSRLGNHYTEQYKYLDKKCKIHIVKLENLNNELISLFKKYKLNYTELTIKPKIANSKMEHNKTVKFEVKDFSRELIKLINTVYDKDFTAFGYAKINI
jgi:Sulfotransferase family